MSNLFSSKSTLFITLLSTLAASAMWWNGYFVTLNKPWFTLPLWLLAVLWVGLGVSLWRSFEVFHDSLLLAHDETLHRTYALLWILYTGGLYAMFWVGVAWLGWAVTVTLMGALGFLVLRAYPRSEKLGRLLRPAVYIGTYFLVVTLYVWLHN